MISKVSAVINSFWEILKKVVLFVIKWRYLLALVVFVFCVAFKVSGTSINEYNKIFENYDDYKDGSLLLGKSRSIRSDEWLVHTPYYMSQAYNDYGKESNMMSLEGQDMIIGYNAPVVDVTLIAKPFTWGYVMLGNDYGLSWYWCSKLILLILVSFEACMIITKKNKKVSLLGAIMVAFAPTVQWWFVPHATDVVFWGLALFTLAYHFFVSEKWWRLLFSVLLSLSAISFVIALYPPLQIPIGLTMLVLFVVCLIRDKKEIKFKKKDIWQIILIASFVGGVLLYTVLTSKDAILALYNTAYPGKRVSVGGGGGFKALFTDLTTFVLPFKDITYSNNCEISTFIQFAPIFYMLYPVIFKKMKREKNMIVGNALLICIIVIAVFMLVGFPELLSKLTLFSYIETSRMGIAYGLAAVLFTVWGVDMIWKKQIFSKKQILLVLAIFGLCYVCFIGANELSYLGRKQYFAIIAGLMILGYLMLGGYQRLFLTATFVVVLVSGATINPVAVGTKALFDHPLEQKIKEIAGADKESYWFSLNSTILAQLGIANGARVLNAVNFYPDFEKWGLVDEDGKYNEIYNRYAHINVSLVKEKTEILPGPSSDSVVLKLNCEDSLKFPVKYLVSAGELTVCNDYYKNIYNDTEGPYYIYERVKW